MRKISIRGVVVLDDDKWVYEFLDISAVCPSEVAQIIAEAEKEAEVLTVEINSGGGSVFAGSEIYTMLKDYSHEVTVKILGLAGSSASVIAMAGDKVLMSPTSQFMYHNASGQFYGDQHDMEKGAEIIRNTNKAIANAYRLKTGRPFKDLLVEMDAETWLDAEKAKALGFIDEIMFTEKDSVFDLVASFDATGALPRSVIDKIRNTVPSPTQQKRLDIANAKLEILKLKGE